ncbi:Phospholipase A1-Ibeta2, chloroplastic [Apostasia shenzhenica]|uniref:Phospholipase A1-Ibeta2, chloroplastic n=1 Tax=Apostasia shenzhenica TaxID=1088818 RepID=A0A2H9ZWF8_9ASPA|nr:Phospholipase A1-Ibeta2, chloroplastic [Apostasia shenzhenica]
MTVGAAVRAHSRPLSPSKSTTSGSLDARHRTPPRATLQTAASAPAATVDTRTHISNLDRVLLKSVPHAPALIPNSSAAEKHVEQQKSSAAGGLLHALNLSSLFPSNRSSAAAAAAAHDVSPRSLAQLQRLLSDSSRPSPKSSIAERWRLLHGADNWSGLLDPLDENLRRELVKYGDLVQAAYRTFHSNPAASPSRSRLLVLPDRNYRATRSLFATSSVKIPHWLDAAAAAVPPWMTQLSSWIGFVAVCDNDREIARMGRRDIVVSLRGTATALEWAEDLRAALHPIEPTTDAASPAKVSSGFWSLYKTSGGPQIPSLSAAVVDEVRRLVEQYRGEELSITVTGHSLGAALALLVADDLSAEIESAPPISVVSFGGPRVGNRGFAERVERRGVKVLRVVNANDMVTRVPGVMPAGGGGGGWRSHVLEGYAHVGAELWVDNRASPYLRPDADPACCHDLEAYLHLVDGFMGTRCPFRSDAKRSLAQLLSQQRPNLKKIYVDRARALGIDPVEPDGRASGVHHRCLPSPSR